MHMRSACCPCVAINHHHAVAVGIVPHLTLWWRSIAPVPRRAVRLAICFNFSDPHHLTLDHLLLHLDTQHSYIPRPRRYHTSSTSRLFLSPIMTRTLEDDTDPTYTHFSHRTEFLAHLADFLSLDLSHDPSESEQEHEEGLVRAMGAIVSTQTA